MQSCNQTVGRSPVLRGSGDFFLLPYLWIKLRSTTGNRSPKAWKPRAIPKAGFTFVPVQLLMRSLIPCQTSQSCWMTLLDLLDNWDGAGHRALARLSQRLGRRGRGNPRTFHLPSVCSGASALAILTANLRRSGQALMPNWMQLIPGEGPAVSDDESEGSGAFNASFGGGLRGLPLFLRFRAHSFTFLTQPAIQIARSLQSEPNATATADQSDRLL